MSIFTWAEIKLPSSYYTSGTSFAEAFSISPNGQNIVGTFGLRLAPGAALLSGEFHGFLRPVSGFLGMEVFASYDYPDNAPAVESQVRLVGATSARGINDAGDVVGFYRDETRNKHVHGFLWRHGEKRPVDLDPPLAIFPDPADLTRAHNAALGINNHQGIVIGVFQQAPNKDCGYVLGGNLLVVDIAQFKANVTRTTVRGSNARLEIVGSYSDLSGEHGYKLKVDRDDISLEADPVESNFIDVRLLPNSRTGRLEVTTGNTLVNGINDQGWIVGQYDTFETRPDGRASTQHGFVWKPDSRGIYAPGKHVAIDIVGAKDTVVNGIANNGTFVGFYIDGVNNTGRHAFVGRLLP